MSKAFVCPMCSSIFDFEAETRPMMLLCGHTMCLQCVTAMDEKICPSCLAPFNTQLPNTTLRDIMLASHDFMLASALASEELRIKTEQEEQIRAKEFLERMRVQREEEAKTRAKNALEAQIKAIPGKTAALKLRITQLDEFVRDSEERFEAAREDLKRARANADSARKELAHLGVTLQRLTKSLASGDSADLSEVDGTDPSASIDMTSFSDDRAEFAIRQVIQVESNTLEDLMEQMFDSNAPDIYDLQGRDMQMLGNRSPDIKTSGVTWRNGTIRLFEDQYLSISGTGVSLECIIVTGGRQGVWVRSDSSLSMTACEVRNCRVGIEMSALYGGSSLEAKHVKVVDCIEAFHLRGKSEAKLIDCEIWASPEGSVDCGIKIEEESSLVGTRVRISGVRSDVLFLRDSARLSLTDCKLTGNPGALQFISGKGAVKYSNCDLDDKTIQQEPKQIIKA